MGRAIALFALIVLVAIAAVPLFRFRLPSTFDGLRRLDRGSGLAHRPATALADELAAGERDQVSLALWRAHVEQALRAANALKAGTPRPRLPSLRSRGGARAGPAGRLRHVLCGVRRARPAHHRGVRLGRRRAGEEFPRRRLGDAADLHRQAAGDPARRPRRRNASGRGGADRAGRQRAGDPRERRERTRGRHQRRHRGRKPRGCADATRRNRGAPLYHHGSRHRDLARRARRRCDLHVRGHSGSRADHRAHQGPGAAGARLAAARLQDRGRLRRHRRAGDVRAEAEGRSGRPGAATALRRAGLLARAAAGAHAQRRRPDHEGSLRSSLGRRRGGADADRERRGRQRGLEHADRVQVAGARVRQAAAARADRAAAHPGARRRGEAEGADGARRAVDRAGTVHAGAGALSRPALDLLRADAARSPTTSCATSWRGCGRWR